ncbi:MAG: glycosyltransferase [Nitrospiraceae bacterium]|nr:MAG: glycosyltransferase [Nitrospiraceae bacterium]
MSGDVRFSIILPVCHGGTFLKSALRSLDKMDYPPELFEVRIAVQADDSVSQAIITEESSRMKAAVTYIETDTKNRSAMLNLSINEARGRVLVFADDDCIFLSDWLNNIDSVLAQEHNVGVVGGQDIQAENESSFNLALDHIFNSFIGTGGLRRGIGQRVGKYYPKLWNMAIPREIADHVASKTSNGLSHVFDESLTVHEDVELVSRIEQLGKLIVYAPEVRVLHSRDTTLPSFVMRNFNMARTSRSIGVHMLPHSVLSIFMLGMPGIFLSSTYFHPLRNVFVVVMMCYGLILLYGALGGLYRTKRFSVVAYVPVLLMSIHFARGLGFLFPWRKSRSSTFNKLSAFGKE